MKTIEKDELYRTISEFMKSKGLELTDGPYAGHIRRGCDLLSDAINATQRTVVRAREEMDKKLLKLRQCIHEATAPNPPPPPPPPSSPPSAATEPPAAGKAAARAAKKKTPTRRQAAPARGRARRRKAASSTRDA